MPSTDQLDSASARQALVRTLQLAYSAERAAAFAYRGHAKSVRDADERTRILEIEEDEWHHRRRVGEILIAMGHEPSPRLERKYARIGKAIALFCRVGGWFLPMYGAGKLESANVGEYEEAARFAWLSGHAEFCDDLVTMAEVEWDHEWFFRAKAASHFLWRIAPKWPVPAPRESIRESFESFRRSAASPSRGLRDEPAAASRS